MIKKIDLKFVLGAVACFVIAFQIINGTSGIYFADPINEMFFAALCFMGGIMGLAASKK